MSVTARFKKDGMCIASVNVIVEPIFAYQLETVFPAGIRVAGL